MDLPSSPATTATAAAAKIIKKPGTLAAAAMQTAAKKGKSIEASGERERERERNKVGILFYYLAETATAAANAKRKANLKSAMKTSAMAVQDSEEDDVVEEIGGDEELASQAFDEEKSAEEEEEEEDEDANLEELPPSTQPEEPPSKPVKAAPAKKRRTPNPNKTPAKSKKKSDAKAMGKVTTYGKTASFKEEQLRLSGMYSPALKENEKVIDFSRSNDLVAGGAVYTPGTRAVAGQDIMTWMEDRLVTRYGRTEVYRNFIVAKLYYKNGKQEFLKLSMNEETYKFLKTSLECVATEAKTIPLSTAQDILKRAAENAGG